ncbi:MAG TPA: DUF6687 family protein [Acidimicrobiales bacterium]|nr:DUF6687 family protein [Acidimicrobiales bacterium]
MPTSPWRRRSTPFPSLAEPPALRPPQLPFVALDELGSRPHVVVDGAARPGSVLTLSHWPASPTPIPLWRDLSAEIALAYLDAPEHWRDAEAVTLDHLDADGLVSLLVLVDPAAARERARLLVAVARAGDFDVVEERPAALVAFALRALADPARSPLGGRDAGPTAWLGRCAGAVLEILPALCDHPEDFSELSGEEAAALEASHAAFASGSAELHELPASQLAAVCLNTPVPGASGRIGSGAGRLIGLHPAAIHARTAMPRVLVVEPGRTSYYDRYETWVRFTSARLACRVDLGPLAEELNALEGGGRRWSADPPARTRPVLACEEGTGLAEGDLLAVLTRHLAGAPAAWDPFAANPAFP